jgi:uncharacterized membrane protein YdjX (TVP38/TMEM64 family)
MLCDMQSVARRILVVVTFVALLALLGGWTRSQLGIQLEVESVRRFAESLGPAGPILFVLLVAGRGALALPSQIVLIAAGLCFGTLVGTIIGGLGLMLSGLMLFLLTRYAGRETVDRRIGLRGRRLLDLATKRSGAFALTFVCGYPIAPLSPMQAAAGLTPMPILYFVTAAFVGGSIRALIFAYFGDALIDADWMNLVLATATFVLVMFLPLAFPRGRTWLREILDPASTRNDAGA